MNGPKIKLENPDHTASPPADLADAEWWRSLISRRGELIHRKNRGGLTTQERAELDSMDAAVDAVMALWLSNRRGERMTIAELVRQSWQIAEDKGFHFGRDAGRDNTLLRLCLIHTEVSEAAQEVKRHGTADPAVRHRLALELADVLIRCADLAGCLDLDLQEACLAKLEANRQRPHLYGTPGVQG